jgi:hypothetical protein
MFINIYRGITIHILIYSSILIHNYLHVNTSFIIYIYIYVHIYMYVYMYVCMYTYICIVYIDIYIHVYIGKIQGIMLS